jgi:hypothetical protein
MKKGLLRISKAERSIPTSKRKLFLIKLKHDKLIEELIKRKQIDEGELEPENWKAHWALIDSLGERIAKVSRQEKMLKDELKLETEPSERLKKKVLLRKFRLKTRFKEKARFNEFIQRKAKEIDLEHFIPMKAKELALKHSPEGVQAHLAMAAQARILDALGLPKNKAETLKKTWALSFLVTGGIRLIPLPLSIYEKTFGVAGKRPELPPVRAETMKMAINHALFAVDTLSHEKTTKTSLKKQWSLKRLLSWKSYFESRLKEVNKLKPSTEVNVSMKDNELFLDAFGNLTWYYYLNNEKLGALNIAMSDTYKAITDKLFS